MNMTFDPAFIRLFFVFFGIAFLRNTVIYWTARILATKASKKIAPTGKFMKRMQVFMSGDKGHRGVAAIHRWGPLAVVASFLAPGTKTVINIGAGLTRMRYVIYLPALILGCAIHGTIYATIGWAAWVTMLKVAAGSPWGISAIIVVGMGLVTAVIILVRKVRRANNPPLEEPDPLHNGFEI